MNHGFVIDNRKCIGCHACSVACKAENQVPVGSHRTWVKYVEKGEFPDTRRVFSVTRCNHCENPPCVHICPVTALFKRPDGIVDFNQDLCIGCKACLQACPYDALYIHPDKGTAEKCHYCAHRVERRLEPPCVVVCPTHAIISGDMDEPGSEIAQLLAREATTVRKPEQGTRPKVFYIDGDAAALTPLAATPSNSYMWTSVAHAPAGGYLFEEAAAGHERRWSPRPAAAGVAATGASSGCSVPAPPGAAVATMAAPPAPLLDIGALLATGFAPARQVTRRSRLRRTHDVAHEKPWGATVSAYVFTKSIASGTLLVALLMAFFGHGERGDEMQIVASLVALVFTAVTGLLLVADLERPERFLSVLLRPQWRSWLAIGAYILTAYSLYLVVRLAALLLGAGSLLAVLAAPGAVLAVAAAVYTAFLFAQAEGRDFWQSPALAPGLLLHALVAGSAVLLAIASQVAAWADRAGFLAGLLAGSLAVHLFVVLAGELYTGHASAEAAAAAHMIRRGRFAWLFWGVVVVLGHAVSLALLLGLPSADAPAMTLAAALACLGLVTWSHCFVEAGQAVPIS